MLQVGGAEETARNRIAPQDTQCQCCQFTNSPTTNSPTHQLTNSRILQRLITW
jgi:hypothetical protein